jgi:hypothetical protein
MDHPVISYSSLELLAQDRAQERSRERAMAALAAQLQRGSGRGNREHLARLLRSFARRIDPLVEPSRSGAQHASRISAELAR